MEERNIIAEKSFAFSLKMVELYKIHLKHNEYILSKQLLRSSTSIGANVEEAIGGIRRKDFIAKLSIATKEARETRYWLKLLQNTQLIRMEYSQYLKDITEITNILTAIIKTSQTNNNL